MKRTDRRPAARAGFTLLEMLLAIAILATLAAVAVPVAGTVADQKRKAATESEMRNLGQAVVACFEDTGVVPARIRDLLVAPGWKGWTGPYLPGDFDDSISGSRGYQVDGWSRAYTVRAASDVVTIRSRGADGRAGTDDDLELAIDLTPVRRAATVERLETVNLAIRLYNASHLPARPLPADAKGLWTELVAAKLLPKDPRFQTDAWGDALVPDPPGARPVVRVTSTHLRTSEGSSAPRRKPRGWR